jgi:hypothetical protein
VCSNITLKQLNVAWFPVLVINHFIPHNNGECNSVVSISMFLFRPISQSMHIFANIVTQNMLHCLDAVIVFMY